MIRQVHDNPIVNNSLNINFKSYYTIFHLYYMIRTNTLRVKMLQYKQTKFNNDIITLVTYIMIVASTCAVNSKNRTGIKVSDGRLLILKFQMTS